MPKYSEPNQRAYDLAYSIITKEHDDLWPWADGDFFRSLVDRVLPKIRSEFPNMPEEKVEEFVQRGVARALRKARYDMGRLKGLIAAG